MRSPTVSPVAALGVLAAACASAPRTPVPLVGSPREVAALAGQWEGSYWSAATGRTGSISFALAARGDSASGDVVMIPRGFGRPLQAWDRPTGAAGDVAPHTRSLTITFVRVAAGRVSGALAPYADPETGARLFTTFEGRQSGDAIAGTYTTHVAGSADLQTGEWRVTRHQP